MAFGILQSPCTYLFFEVVQQMTVNYSVRKKIVCLAQSVFFHQVGFIYLLQNPNVKRFVLKYPSCLTVVDHNPTWERTRATSGYKNLDEQRLQVCSF